MTTGQLIKAARKKAGLTQARLSELAGVATITIQQYELGKRQPRIEQLQAIAAALGVPVAQLLPPDNYWEDADGNGHTEPMEPPKRTRKKAPVFGYGPIVAVRGTATSKGRIDAALDRLNDEGQEKAAERVEELTEIPKYQRQKSAPQMAPCPKCGMMVSVSPGSRKAFCPSCNIRFDIA